MKTWLASCDGSAVPNPGRIGLGAVLTEPDGTRHTLSQAAQQNGCNNEAELRALLATLQELKSRRGAHAALALRQQCRCRTGRQQHQAKPNPRLASLFDEARALLNSFDQATLMWIPRHRNSEADALARAALGLAGHRIVKPSRKRR